MKLKMFVVIVAAGLVGGCSAAASRGVVAMKINDTEAHVCVRKIDVEVGDKMAVFHNECTNYSGSSKARRHCRLKRIGEGTISEQLNDHYSVLKFDTPTDYREGDLLEKVAP